MDDDFLRMRIGSEGDRRRLDAAAGSSRFSLINFEHSGTLWWVRANLASPTSRHQHVSDLLECRKDYLLSFVVPFGCELLALAPLFFFRRSLRFAGGVPAAAFSNASLISGLMFALRPAKVWRNLWRGR